MIVLQYLYLLKGNDFYIFMRQYHDLLKKVLGGGDVQFDPRTQESVLGLSVAQSTYDLREGFPLITTKNIPPRLPFEELFWKLRGERNVKSLVDKNIHFWTANAFDKYLKSQGLKDKFPKHSLQWNSEFKLYTEKILEKTDFYKTAGDLGPVYGYQWRHWKDQNGKEVDQLKKILNGSEAPNSSRAAGL